MTKDEQEAIVLAIVSARRPVGDTMSANDAIAIAADIHAAFVDRGATDAEMKAWIESSAEQIAGSPGLSDFERETVARSMFDVFGFDTSIEHTSDGRKRYVPKARMAH